METFWDTVVVSSDILVFNFSLFWFESAYSRPFWGVLGYIPPNDVTHRPDHQTHRTVLVPIARRLSDKTWESVQRFDLITTLRKCKDGQKSHKVVTFRLFGKKPPPHCTDLNQNLLGSLSSRHNHVCRVSNFRIDFCMCATTVHRYCSDCDWTM